MASEAQITSSLLIIQGKLDYQSRPQSFTADVAGSKGPVPGAVLMATTPGTNVSFTELTTPALCRIQNLDPTNFVTIGIWDGVATFHPFMDLLAGETFVIRLASGLTILRGVADTAAVETLVEAFEV